MNNAYMCLVPTLRLIRPEFVVRMVHHSCTRIWTKDKPTKMEAYGDDKSLLSVGSYVQLECFHS